MHTLTQVEALIPALLSAGVLSPADAVRRQVELVPIGRSHPVFRLMLDSQPVAAVKLFGPSRGDTDGDPARESAVLALADTLPELARLLPPALLNHGASGLFAWRWFDGAPAWEDDAPVGGSSGDVAANLVALAERIVVPLAAMHRSSARLAHAGRLDAALAGPCPWGLRLFDGDSPPELWQHSTLAPMLARMATNRALVAGARRARGAWRPVALIHADLKHDNVLVGPGGRIALIDWEMARVGDPAWDLAGLMVRPLLDPESGGWCDANLRAAARLVGLYASASRLAFAPLAQRLVLYCGAWLLMNMVQFRSMVADPGETDTQRMLGVATVCFDQCDQWVERLIRMHDDA